MSTFSDKAKQVIATVAPLLGTALGGPLGAAAGALIASALGTKPGDQDAAETALLNASPDTLMKLKQAEMDFSAKMKELQISEEQLSYNDMASARQMQVGTRDPTAGRLAWLLIGGFLVTATIQVGAMLLFAPEMSAVPPPVWLQIGNVTGYLANEAKQAAAFYFGSSSGSKEKDATLAEIAKGP